MLRIVIAALAGITLSVAGCKKDPPVAATVKSLAAEDVHKFDLLAITAAWEQY